MEVLVFSSVASAIGFGMLGGIWYQVRQLNKQFDARRGEADYTADRVVNDLSARMNLTENTDLDRVAKSVEDMRQDFEWLVSDRMIEQAVEIARTERSTDSIHNMGLSEDEIAAASIFRKH